MAETADAPVIIEEKKEEIVTPISPFIENAWKTTPTVKEEAKPIVEEKKEEPIIEKVEEVKAEEKPKEVPLVPEPLKFANEESEKVFNLLKEGKKDEVYAILHEQNKLAAVDKLPAADIIKLNLQYQNKDFSGEDINELFSERYAMPEKPEQKDEETDKEYEATLEKYEKEVQKVENRIKRDAKPAITELQKLQKEIVLPDIQKETPKPAAPTQEELDSIAKAREGYLQSVPIGVQSFNGYSATFKDEEVEIPVAYTPTEEQKTQMKSLLENFNMDTYFEKRWLDANGNFNAKQLTEDLHLLENRDAIFQKLVSEVGNKRHEASIKSIKNIDYSGNGKSNGDIGENPEQLQKKMATHFFSQ